MSTFESMTEKIYGPSSEWKYVVMWTAYNGKIQEQRCPTEAIAKNWVDEIKMTLYQSDVAYFVDQ